MTFKHYDFNNLNSVLTHDNNVFFGKPKNRYNVLNVKKRLKQLIEKDILYQTKYCRKNKVLHS